MWNPIKIVPAVCLSSLPVSLKSMHTLVMCMYRFFILSWALDPCDSIPPGYASFSETIIIQSLDKAR